MNDLRRIQVTVLLAFCCCALAPQALAQRCGLERWSVKTGTDGDAGRVNLSSPQDATIAELVALSPPNPIPKTSRAAPTETTVFVLNDATLTDYRLEGGPKGDSDYHLVLSDGKGHTMVAEIPSPSCVDPASPFAAQVANARAEFDAKLTPSLAFQTANVPVRVTGVGFFDFAHGQRGAAPNVIELHPVLDISFSPRSGPGFMLLTSSSTIQLLQGGSTYIPVGASSMAGAGNVTFSVGGLPSGITGHITAGSGGGATLTLTAAATAATGTFPFTLTGTAGPRTNSQSMLLNVSAAPQLGGGWEYQVISATSEQDVIDQANKLGADDWEMLSVVRVAGTPSWRAFFRRQKRN